MKNLTFVFLLLLTSKVLVAQKENNVWVGGRHVGLNFEGGNPVLFDRTDSATFWRTNASVCDSAGNLLFYTNGPLIFNRNFQVMQNGDNLDVGDYATVTPGLLSVADGAAIVPKVDEPNKYYVFHVDLNWMDIDTLSQVLLPTHLYYSIVDMSLENGLGGVVGGQKDVLVFSDTLTENGMKIVKHGNGRDYWLLTHEANTNRYFRFLIDPDGIHGPYAQDIGVELRGYESLGFSPLVITQDGSRAAQLASAAMRVDLYDFDRCNGVFSLTDSFYVSDSAYYLLDGEFSSSGQYLYVSANWWNYIFQFDVTSPNIIATRQLIAVYDGATDPFNTDFDKLRLAPDDKIYVASYGSNRSLHVINYPDNLGMACGFVENAVDLYPPGTNWSGLPNVINYSLGALVGSGCDTLTGISKLPTPTFTLGVYPNPFSNELQLSISGANTTASVSVTDVLGREVYGSTLLPVNQFIHQTVDLSLIATGVYFVVVDINGKWFAQKVVKH